MEIKHINNYLGRVEGEERYQKNRMEEQGSPRKGGVVHTFYYKCGYHEDEEKGFLFTGEYRDAKFSFWSSEIKDLRDIDNILSIS